jgi:hypothetical protein
MSLAFAGWMRAKTFRASRAMTISTRHVRTTRTGRQACLAPLPHCTAGQGGDPPIAVRGKAGEGLAAVIHKIDQFSLHSAFGKHGWPG